MFNNYRNYQLCTAPCGRKGELLMDCTDAYKEHIEYTFNAFCKVVIRYAAINAWRDRDKRRQREISFEYLAEERFYPFCTSDTYFIDPYKQYPVMICGRRVILTNGELAEALSSLPEKKREIIYLYFFGRYTQFPDKPHLLSCHLFSQSGFVCCNAVKPRPRLPARRLLPGQWFHMAQG